MPLHRLLSVGRAWLLLAVVSTILGGAIAFAVTVRVPPTYVSRATLIVGPPPGQADININDILVGQALAGTYADLATTRPILEPAIAAAQVDITVDQLATDVTAAVPASTSLIYLTVSYSNAAQSAALANAIADQLAAYGTGKPTSTSGTIVVTVVDPAVPPSTGQKSRVMLSTALGAAIGFALIVCLGFLVEAFQRETREARAERLRVGLDRLSSK